MNKKSNLLLLNRIIYILEFILSILIIVGIVISIPDLIKYFVAIIHSTQDISYELLKGFLAHVLMLVIGLEFIHMLLAHSDASIIYLMIMVIARKMLIYAETAQDLLIGVLGLLVLFIIKRFLIMKRMDGEISSGIFSAATTMENINERFNYEIDDLGFTTIGGLVYYLLNEQGIPVEPGALVSDKDYIYEVEEAKNGTIEAVTIDKRL